MPQTTLIKRQAWVDHKFPNDLPRGWTANIMSRVRDTPIRLRHYALLPGKSSSTQWTIAEHVGHLIELEKLHHNRILQFAKKLKELEPADMSNAATEAADYNSQNINDLLTEFESVRAQSILAFEALAPEVHEHQAFHPRLKMMMRPVDLLFFMAEHDDHHLASIWELLGA